jgi:DNA-directed RNA polymerase II subunit RPB2
VSYLDKDEEFDSRVAPSLAAAAAEAAGPLPWAPLPAGASPPARALLRPRGAGPPALFLPYTHAEIHGLASLGVCSGAIPFSDRNQAPRNTYQVAMGKQAIGGEEPGAGSRFDTCTYALGAPQRPLVATWLEALLGLDERPTGRNASVAVLCYTGYNMEDSLILNQALLDRGAFRTLCTQAVRDAESSAGAERSTLCRPDPSALHDAREASYALLHPTTGLPAPGAPVCEGDVLIGKTVETVELARHLPRGTTRAAARATVQRDRSTVARSVRPGARVARTADTLDAAGLRHVRVAVASLHVPTVGDKFASRHGQKGVVGLILPPGDMPFDLATGEIPDIIMNPHAFPSRMTIGHLVESLAALGVALGRGSALADGTPFAQAPATVESLAALLQGAAPGRDGLGRRRLACGITGEPLRSPVFVGSTFYQPLKHIAVDKLHGRARGPRHALTRQPVEGRSNDGGLRFGEMERDAGLMHGASAFLADRLFEQSDAVSVPVCGRCGLIASPGAHPGVAHTERTALNPAPHCLACGPLGAVRVVAMPCAFRLYCQEMMALGIAPRLELAGVPLRPFAQGDA